MKRWQAIELFDRFREDAIVVHGTGGMGIEVNTKSPSDINIYAPMPYPTPVGLGLALALPKQRVVVMEGDGSALSGLSALATVANMAAPNLINIVWDNGVWLSPGTMGTRRHYGPLPTATGGRTNLESLGRGAGFERSSTVRNLEEFEAALKDAFAKGGPCYIVAKIDREPMPDLPAKPFGTVEQAVNFRRGLIRRGWVSSGHAGVSMGKWLAPEERSRQGIKLPEIQAETETGPRPSLEKARIIYSALREAGIDFFVYLPDSANYFIQRMATEDPQVTSVSVTREDEGLAIAMGAFMGGRNPALIIEASGLGLCPLAFSTLGHEQRMAALILYGHNFALGEVRDVHACTRWVAEPILDALRIPNLTLMDVKDAPLILKQAWRTVRGQMCSVAVSLPLHVLWDE